MSYNTYMISVDQFIKQIENIEDPLIAAHAISFVKEFCKNAYPLCSLDELDIMPYPFRQSYLSHCAEGSWPDNIREHVTGQIKRIDEECNIDLTYNGVANNNLVRFNRILDPVTHKPAELDPIIKYDLDNNISLPIILSGYTIKDFIFSRLADLINTIRERSNVPGDEKYSTIIINADRNGFCFYNEFMVELCYMKNLRLYELTDNKDGAISALTGLPGKDGKRHYASYNIIAQHKLTGDFYTLCDADNEEEAKKIINRIYKKLKKGHTTIFSRKWIDY